MTGPITVAVGQAAERVAQIIPTAEPEIPDMTIEKLRLVGALKQGGINVDVTQVIANGKVNDSTTGAPEMSVDLLDRDNALLESGVFGQTVDVEIDHIPYRLVEVSLTGPETLTLLFEHKLVNVLRQYRSPFKAARSSVTRAQVIELLLREAIPTFGPVRYVSPEENKVQPIAASKASGRSLTAKTVGTSLVTKNVHESGFGLTHLDIRYWDGSTVVLGPTQLKNASIVLQVCKQLNANPKATLAVVAACIVEPAKPFENTVGGGGGSSGILQWVNKPWANDVAQAVAHALQDPGATGQGGMISLAQKNPGWTAGHVAQAEQGSAFPARYDAAVPGAQRVIDTFSGAGGYTASGVNFGAAGGTTYEFSRGQPGQPEDSWVCMQRLAKEVNWRVFVTGRNSLYFVTDDDLMKAPTTYSLRPGQPGILNLTFDAEVGGRTVKIHRHRQPKPSEAHLTARVSRWVAPPGSIIALDGYGPGDGRWIVVDTERPLFDRQATVGLQSPQAPLPEPAATSSIAATSVSPGAITVRGASLSASTRVPGHPELRPKISVIVNTVLAQFPQLVITSTISGGHASGSYHYLGEAADIAGPNMNVAAAWIAAHLTPNLTEGIHNPGLSVKNGVGVPSSFWGAATWAQHLNHIHLAVAQ